MLLKSFKLIVVFASYLAIVSCAYFAMDPHENFKAHMQQNVGSSIDSPLEPGVALPKYLLGSRDLPNGNIENKYMDRGACRYFFEYDPATRIIVDWRFEGSEKDCVISP